MIEDIEYCLELFSKKIFSDANPFYQSHLSIARKHKNNLESIEFQKGVSGKNDFKNPVSI